MNGLPRIYKLGALAALAALLSAGLYACVGAGVAVDGGAVDVNYEGDFYEPYGYVYGGWGSNYRVGPPRGGDHRFDHHGTPAYRAAPAARPTPSIPNHPRGR